jgi:hypothetical protein
VFNACVVHARLLFKLKNSSVFAPSHVYSEPGYRARLRREDDPTN